MDNFSGIKEMYDVTIRNTVPLEFNGKKYDNQKIYERFAELLEEFLEPYVIESTLKED